MTTTAIPSTLPQLDSELADHLAQGGTIIPIGTFTDSALLTLARSAMTSGVQGWVTLSSGLAYLVEVSRTEGSTLGYTQTVLGYALPPA